MRDGWQLTTVGDACEIVNGGTPKTNIAEYWGGRHFWITPAEMGKRASPYAAVTVRKLTDLGLADCSARLLPPLSVILSSRAPIGHLVINIEPMATNQGCKGLVPRKSLDHKFLFYYLTSIVEHLNELGTGTTFKELSGGKLNDVRLPLPPLSEQKRIVALLDNAFEGIDAALAITEKNLANVRELFDSYRNDLFETLCKSGTTKALGDICKFENGDRGKNYPNRTEYVESGIPWINTGHIQPDGTLSLEQMNFITRKKFNSLRGGKIQPGDLVYCLRGATLGKTALVAPLAEGAVASSLVILRPSHLLESRFLYHFLTSPIGQGIKKLYENGAAQPNLGAKSVAKYRTPLPIVEKQRAVVRQIDTISVEIERLAFLSQRKLDLFAGLKQAILQKAFAGDLTARSLETVPQAAE